MSKKNKKKKRWRLINENAVNVPLFVVDLKATWDAIRNRKDGTFVYQGLNLNQGYQEEKAMPEARKPLPSELIAAIKEFGYLMPIEQPWSADDGGNGVTTIFDLTGDEVCRIEDAEIAEHVCMLHNSFLDGQAVIQEASRQAEEETAPYICSMCGMPMSYYVPMPHGADCPVIEPQETI